MNAVTEETQEKEIKSSVGYVGRRPSRKEVKIMLMNATSAEERRVLVSLMPKPQRRHG